MRIHHVVAHSLLFILFGLSLSAQEAQPMEIPVAGYNKGFFVAHGEDYYLRVNGRAQTRAQFNYYDRANHETRLSLPNARLSMGGHVLDPRVGFLSQLAFDNGNFKLVEFFGNFVLVQNEINLKVGRFLGNYSLLETVSAGKLAFGDRPSIFGKWRIDGATGLSLHTNKKKPFSWDISLFENGESLLSKKRLGGVSANIAFNHNEIDAADDMDFQGGPFRFVASLGGFTRARVDAWKLVGYGGALETMIKAHGATISAGFLTGTPEAKIASQTADDVVQTLGKEQIILGGYGQFGYLFDQRFGLAVRYNLDGTYSKAPTFHEILGGASVFFFEHNLKFQLDGGTYLANNKVAPLVRGQLQLAF